MSTEEPSVIVKIVSIYELLVTLSVTVMLLVTLTPVFPVIIRLFEEVAVKDAIITLASLKNVCYLVWV